MDRRLTILETRFDTILPTLVTKAEFNAAMGRIDVQFANMQLEIEKSRFETRHESEKLRTEMHQMFATLMKWWIGLTVTLIVSFAGMFYSMLRAISP